MSKKVTDKIAVKKTAKNIIKKEEPKSSKKINGKYILNYNITAYAQKEEDFSGATIFEWFDSGREIDAIASPYAFAVFLSASTNLVKLIFCMSLFFFI